MNSQQIAALKEEIKKEIKKELKDEILKELKDELTPSISLESEEKKDQLKENEVQTTILDFEKRRQ